MSREFKLLSITQVSMARIRVQFSLFPLNADDQQRTDALNPKNYVLSGPGVTVVSLVQRVSGQPDTVELLLNSQLTIGNWTLTVNNVQTPFGETLKTNTISFVSISVTTPITDGAKDATAEDVLHKNFNPALIGKAWDAIIAAIAIGDTNNWTNAKLAFDQMFIISASGKYLDRKTGDVGITRPIGVGMSDELFRKLAIAISSDKLTQEVLLEILEIFYGSDAVRGSAMTDLVGPFALTDGDDIQIIFDELVTISIIFNQANFTSIGIASATEVAAEFNRNFELNNIKAFAVVTIDSQLQEHVKVYSGSLGLSSSVRIIGGRAQNFLQFPHRIPAYNPLNGALPTWNITVLPAVGRVRFTTTGPTGLDLSQLREGDYVNIYGTEFQPANRGTYTVVRVYVAYPLGVLTQYFEIVNLNGVPQAGLAQLADGDLYYFRPVKETISKYNGVSVLQGGGVVDINLPATTQAVNRGYLTAAYANENNKLTASNFKRSEGGLVQLTIPNHGLVVGQQIEIINAMGNTTQPTTTTGGAGNTDYSLGTIWSNLTTSAIQRKDHTATTLKDGRVLTVGGYSDGAAAWLNSCELFRITSTTIINGARQFAYTNSNAGVLPAAIGRHKSLLMTHPVIDSLVLATGGYDGVSAKTACYLYTPAPPAGAGAWTTTGAMSNARYYHDMAVLSDSRVMVTGGTNGTPTNTVEIFNPLTLTWSTVNPLIKARYRHTMTLLQNGSVLVCGGIDGSGGATPHAEIWDALSGNWSATGRMSWARSGHSAVLLSDGRVLVIGGTGFLPRDGVGAAAPLTECEIYDPINGVWSPGGHLSFARNIPTVGIIGNQLIVSGGGSVNTELLDLKTLVWSKSRAVLPDNRDAAPGAVMPNGVLYSSDGIKAGLSTAASFLFVPASERIYSGGLNGIFRIANVPDANTIQFYTVERSDLTTISNTYTVYPVAARTLSTLGPHTYDPIGGAAVTAIESVSNTTFTEGLNYQYIDVADATVFPDTNGWLCLGFGTNQQVNPIRYFGRLSNTRLKLDFKFKFPKNVSSGVKVTYLVNKGAWVPNDVPPTGALYITGSNAGVAVVSNLVDGVLAGGVKTNKQIVYPGDRGLGGEGLPVKGTKVSDKVLVWGPDDLVITHAGL